MANRSAEGSPMTKDSWTHEITRSPLARAALSLAGLFLLTGFSWFGRSLVNGYYVSRGSNAAVIMARLVEAPRGHLSGALVATTVEQGGSRPQVKRVTVQGSITGDNVILKTPGFFGAFRAVYVGTLEGDRLTLSRQGHSSFTLYLSSAAGYQRQLAKLDSLQTSFDTVANANRIVRNLKAYVKRLSAAIPRYIAWGRARIARQTDVKAWWQRKTEYYDACLAKIRPLAAEGVPAWRWNSCAMTVRNDKWNRDQLLASIRHDQQIDRVQGGAIAHMIVEAPIKARIAAAALHAACPDSTEPASCEDQSRRIQAAASSAASIISKSALEAFQTLRPQVQQALRNDAEVSAKANARLRAVAAKVTAILNDPSRFRAT
jgi:hypothetical protein